MKRRNIWYRRSLFRQDFRSYKDWDKYNPPSDFKEPARYRSEAVVCLNPECPREHQPISEHEAYYYFAKKHLKERSILGLLRRFKFLGARVETGGCYVCPFCGGSDVGEYERKDNVHKPKLRTRMGKGQRKRRLNNYVDRTR